MCNWDNQARHKARVELIPMIDVMMFLLAFFVLISINVIPATGLKTKLPGSSQTQDMNLVKPAIVSLGKGGEIQLDGQAVPLEALAAKIRSSMQADRKRQVVINGDREVELQRLIEIVDALKAGGVDGFAIAAKKKS